jgi:hypothetical protein
VRLRFFLQRVIRDFLPKRIKPRRETGLVF